MFPAFDVIPMIKCAYSDLHFTNEATEVEILLVTCQSGSVDI
jgi:hypothetical protein